MDFKEVGCGGRKRTQFPEDRAP